MPRLVVLCLLSLAFSSACSSTTSRSDDAGSDTGPIYGRCGPAVHACVCGGATLPECLSLEPDCSVCLSQHAETCCGPESSAYYACVSRVEAAGGPCPSGEAACVARECATEASALQGCLSSPACEAGMAGCVGTTACE